MACFKKMCGKGKKQKHPPVDHILKTLEETEALLLKQQEDLEKQIEECIAIAKSNATKNKRMSLRALQKKKRLEKNLEQVDQTIATLELQKDALHNAKTNAVILGSMKAAGKAIKNANIKLDIDKAQTVMDNISEQHSVGNEISTIIRKSLVVEDIDEDELTRELEQLQNEEEIKPRTEPIVSYPSIPAELDTISPYGNEEVTHLNEIPSAATDDW